MGSALFRTLLLAFFLTASLFPPALRVHAQEGSQPAELLVTENEIGRAGGRLVVALRSEPKTLNPATAVDGASLEAIRQITADLVHINRYSQQTEPALAKSWKVSPDGRSYSLRLRRGLKFSDGEPCDADDVVFSFQVYLDEKAGSPQRDLLLVGGKPIRVQKIDSLNVLFELPQPYAAGDRLFDSFAILPRHLLESAYREGTLARAWTLATPPKQIAGLGPFRLKEYEPGQKLVLERNPYFWKIDSKGSRLPYLNEIVFLFVPSEEAQVIRFRAGETDSIDRLSAESFAMLGKDARPGSYRVFDLGPSLEYTFLFFNLNSLGAKKLPDLAPRQHWFQTLDFRKAVSAALDREAIVRLVYQGRATPLGTHVTPGNKLWVDPSIPRPARSIDRARQLLREAGFSWRPDGGLIDRQGQVVEFSIATSSSNTQRVRIASLIQDDLRALGMRVTVTPLESRALLDRIFNSHNYEACLLTLGSGDVDPNGEINVWVSSGPTHLWNLGEKEPATPWEAEIDRLMREQLSTRDAHKRKRLYDRVQQLVAENLPVVCLVSPHLLVAAKETLGNFQPAILEPHTLWNSDRLFIQTQGTSPRR